MKRSASIPTVLAVCLAVLAAAAAEAQVTDGQWAISPYVGRYAFDDAQELADANVLGLRLGYAFTNRWGAELVVDQTEEADGNGLTSNTTLSRVGVDGLYHFLPERRIVPFLAAGVGMASYDPEEALTENGAIFNAGAGIKAFLTERLALRLDARRLYSDQEGASHSGEYTAGLAWTFGGGAPPPDADGDGVADSDDKCPGTPAGTKVDASGCPPPPPDSDKDGVIDSADKCPDTPAGTKVDPVGCPVPQDEDGDGVADPADKCPNTPAGTRVDAAGCPVPQDADGDGVIDSADKCPNTPAGTKVDAAGCPLDSDRDGVIDSADRCPDTPAGAKVDANGCPLPPPKELLHMTLKVEFDTGKWDIRDEYRDEIKRVGDFMTSYPEAKGAIEGHTDNAGSRAGNMELSRKRAEAVRDYIVKNFGVSADRLSAVGYGPDKPIADNGTREGRQRNRRIEANFEVMAVKK